VRRESIRALVGITDRTASNLLVSALTDEDAQNVQLAARYLGLARVQGAVPALMQVARGEGRGNREIAPRVEAVEALGRIGSSEALGVVSELATKRVLKGPPREVRAAAESAMAQTATVGGAR
jgi:HEAT repeat protein